MRPGPAEERGAGQTPGLVALWMGGASLRVTMMALPPVLPLISRSLHMGPAELAALANMPVLLLATAALTGSAVTSALGSRRAVVGGLAVVALAGALRGIPGTVVSLFAASFAMGAGIAVVQTALPALSAEWFPGRLGLATAVYGNGMVMAEAAAAGATLPFVLPLVGSWQMALVVWSLPVGVTVAVLSHFTKGRGARVAGAALPDWREWRAWALGLSQGAGSGAYFAASALLPAYLVAQHRAGLVGPALALLNGAQLPASVLFTLVPGRMLRPRVLVSFTGACLAALGGIVWAPSWGTLVATGVLGFCTAIVLLSSLAYAPILGGPARAAQLSGGMFTIAYALSFVLPVLGGSLWQATGVPAIAFAPPALGVVAGIVAAAVGFGEPDPTPAAQG